MLDFVNKPPKRPEEATISEAGRYVLQHPGSGSPEVMRGVGSAILSEIIDAFGARVTPDRVIPYVEHVYEQAREFLKDDEDFFTVGAPRLILAHGMGLPHEYGRNKNAERLIEALNTEQWQ